MNNIAFTWVWNDMVELEMWCKYYSRYFDELLVLCCATKPEYDETLALFKEKYNLTAERLPNNEYNVQTSKEVIKAKQVELFKDHRWVLFSNCDEIVCTDPQYYKDLREFMEKCPDAWTWCIGWEVLQEPEEPHLDMSKPLLRQRTSWLKNFNMNKVMISRVPLSWNDGLHQIDETQNMAPIAMPEKGLILLHMKHIDFTAERDYIQDRRPRYGFVMEKFGSRVPMPEWVKDVI